MSLGIFYAIHRQQDITVRMEHRTTVYPSRVFPISFATPRRRVYHKPWSFQHRTPPRIIRGSQVTARPMRNERE
jgi:hypothetical protein